MGNNIILNNVSYGSHERQIFDIAIPENPKPLAVLYFSLQAIFSSLLSTISTKLLQVKLAL